MSQAHSVPAQQPFLSTAEIWRGTPNAEVLQLAEVGTFAVGRPAPPDSNSSSILGELLAQRLWKESRAAVTFLHSNAGHANGAVLGIPWYESQNHEASLLLACAASGGTLEVWEEDPERDELRLSSGFFGKWDEFRRVTASTRFAKGAGLPGRVWESRQPVLFEDLGESRAFLRAEAARSVGLEFGLGLPVHYAAGFGVVVLLSSRSTPIARSIDIWRMCNPEDIEHLQGLTVDETGDERIAALVTAKQLALATATQFSPRVLSSVFPQDSSASEPRPVFGWAWPSRDRFGIVQVVTLLS